MVKKIKGIASAVWQYKIVEYLSYFAVILVPLYFAPNNFSIFNAPKLVIMNAVSLLMAVFFLWGNWKADEFKIKFSLLNIILLVFVLILTLSSIFGIDQINSFFGWDNTTPLITVFAFTIFSLILGSLIKKDKKIITKLLSVSFITSIVTIIFFYVGLSGASKYIEDGSTLGNSSYLGAYILFNFFFGLGLFLYSKKLWKKILIAVSMLFIVVNPLFINKEFLLGKIGLLEIIHNPILLFGIANGAMMGVGLSIIFIIFLFMAFSKKKILKIIGLILIGVLLLGVFFTGKALIDPNTNLHKVFTAEKSGNRFIAWDIAKQGYLASPILGNGYNNYIYNFDKYYNPDLYKNGYIVERLTEPHNVIYEFASNTGVLGLVGYLGLLIILFFTLYGVKNKEEDKKFNNIRIVLAGLLFGYFIQNLFVFDTVNTYLTLFIVISIGLGFAKDYEWNLGKKYIILNKTFIVIGILFCLYMMKIIVSDPWIESKAMNKIMNETKDISKFADLRNGVQEQSVFGGVMDYTIQTETLFKLYQTSLYKITDKNKDIFISELDSATSYLEKQIKMEPNISYPYIVDAKMLNLRILAEMKNGEYVRFDGKDYNKVIWDKSYNSLMKAIGLNKNNPQAYIVLSQLYMIKGDFYNARLFAKRSIDLAPEYEDFYVFARSLVKISPDKDFEDFLNSMESKYVQGKA